MRMLSKLTLPIAIASTFLAQIAAGQVPASRNAPPAARQGTGVGPNVGRSPINASTALTDGRAGPRVSQVQASRRPQGWEITPQQEKWIDQILNYWEARSSKVDRFACRFERWEYKPTWVKDPKTPWSQATGEIKYEKQNGGQPPKAMYRAADVRYYQAPQAQGQQASYVRRDDMPGEYWVCDGKATFEFDHRNKQVIQRPLPPQLQGQAIADGPLPFLFGAKAAKLKQRYWFKPLAPPKVVNPQTGKLEYVQGEYWLAAKPKTLDDAQNYELVEIVIDQKEFLPKAMQIYMPGGKERKVFEFKDRDVNPRQRLWSSAFIAPNVPRGWTLHKEDPVAQANAAQNAIRQRRAQGGSHIPVPQRR